MCVHFHRFAPVVPAQNPALRASCQGSGCPPRTPCRCFGLYGLSQRSALAGAKKRLGPLSATGMAASASVATGSARALLERCCPRCTYKPRWAARLGCPLPGRQGWTARLGAAGKNETSCKQVETRPGSKGARLSVSGSFNCCQKVSFRSRQGESGHGNKLGAESGADFEAEFEAESASELRRKVRQSLPQKLRQFLEGERGEWIGKAGCICG